MQASHQTSLRTYRRYFLERIKYKCLQIIKTGMHHIYTMHIRIVLKSLIISQISIHRVHTQSFLQFQICTVFLY